MIVSTNINQKVSFQEESKDSMPSQKEIVKFISCLFDKQRVMEFENSDEKKKSNVEIINASISQRMFVRTKKRILTITRQLGTGDYFLALKSLQELEILPPNRILDIIHNPDFDDPVMQNTIIDISALYVNCKSPKDTYAASIKIDRDTTRYAYLIINGQISIFSKFIGKGCAIKAKVRHELVTGVKDAGLFIKGDNAEKIVNANQKNLKKVEGFKNIIPPYKSYVSVCTKSGKLKYIANQQLYKRNANKLIGTRFHHALCVMKDVAMALADLHKNNLVHSDVKLDNIYINGNLKNKKYASKGVLGDLGYLTERGIFGGCSPAYMSPEVGQACLSKKNKSEKEIIAVKNAITDKFDCFSFGISLFKVATRKDILSSGYDFWTVTDDQEIRATLSSAIEKLKKTTISLSKQKRKENLMKIDLLRVAAGLLRFDPLKRDSSEKAMENLTELCQKYNVSEQHI